MGQRTTLKAEDLFGDLFNPDDLQGCTDSFEKCWQWPEEIGAGEMFMIQLRPGLVLGIGNYQIIEDIEVYFEFKQSPMALGFCLSGNVQQTVNYEKGQKNLYHLKRGHSVMTYLPECYGTNMASVGNHASVNIFINPSLFKSLIGNQQDYLPADLLDITNDVSDKLYYHETVSSPVINVLICQILNCPYQGSMKWLYYESKVLELIVRSIVQFMPQKSTSVKNTFLRPDEVDRIREAENILIHNLNNPPSLLNLARLVGTNKTTLNNGFRQVFGNSVFERLRIHRLERGRELLESRTMNVTEVAFEVGYSQQSNFTKAFKGHFGTNPMDHLR